MTHENVSFYLNVTYKCSIPLISFIGAAPELKVAFLPEALSLFLRYTPFTEIIILMIDLLLIRVLAKHRELAGA